MSGSLAAFQTSIGRAFLGPGPCAIDPNSPGFRFTATVRRSWCRGRSIMAAREVLTLLPAAERSRLLDEYVDQGGGLGTFPSVESEAFLAFLAPRLPDPSHALSLCRMDQALARARDASQNFVPPKERASGERVERGRDAALVWFYTDAMALLGALQGGPRPPAGAPDHAVLIGPGMPKLFRLARAEEAKLWASLPTVDADPVLVRRLLAEGVLRYAD